MQKISNVMDPKLSQSSQLFCS